MMLSLYPFNIFGWELTSDIARSTAGMTPRPSSPSGIPCFSGKKPAMNRSFLFRCLPAGGRAASKLPPLDE
jgi:hypothetical protein